MGNEATAMLIDAQLAPVKIYAAETVCHLCDENVAAKCSQPTLYQKCAHLPHTIKSRLLLSLLVQ